MKGYIHSYETFATLDGPGIRFVVFMQGCKLKCKYCHNRDTWKENVGNLVDIETVVDKILNYIPYFKASNGGVTVSGGDPLCQVPFVTELFKRLKMYNIHTALDTSGMFEITDEIQELLKYTDLVLLDIKHISSSKCKKLVGFENDLELAFAKYLSDNNIPVSIRQVVIPGITDDEQDILDLREFLKTLNNIHYIDLLPYRSFGKYKWEELGLKYPLDDVREATNEDIYHFNSILRPDDLIKKKNNRK